MSGDGIVHQDFAAAYSLGAAISSTVGNGDDRPGPNLHNPQHNEEPASNMTAASNAFMQGATEESFKREEQREIGKALSEDLINGAKIHTFDPDASTAEKVAATAGNIGSIAPLGGHASPLDTGVAPSARPVIVDQTRVSELPIPTIRIADINRASREEGEGVGGEKVAGNEGAIGQGVGANLTESVVGWLQSAGGVASNNTIADKSNEETRVLGSNILTEKIPIEFYGTAYHNAGLILFAVLATRAITLLRLSWGWIIILLAFCMSMYSISIERTRSRARDDIQRELMKVRLITETETADWINSLLDRVWLIAEPLLSATIVATVDDVLKSAAFGPVESMRLTTFTLGNKAPRIDHIRTYPATPDDEVIMEWALSFTPNDIEDLTPKQAKRKVNPKIVLSIKLGKGLIGGAMPVLLEDISFKGEMRIKLKLMSNYPHIQMVHMSFMEKPEFDYVLKPLGGEKFGMDINSIPGLSGFIKEQVHANLGPMMYDPNVFTINLEQLLSGTPLDSAIGVLKVHVESARGLKATKVGGGAPDPYVTMGIGLKPAINKTKTIDSTANPTWNESQYILINSLMDTLHLSIFDYNEHRADNLLGTISHELAGLAADAEQEGLTGKVFSDGKDRGELHYNLSFYPVLLPQKLADGTVEPPADSTTGIVRLTIHQAKDLDLSKVTGTLSPYAKVYLGSGQHIHRTPTIKSSNTPIWESSTEFLVPNKNQSTVTIRLQDDREFARNPALGTATIRLTDLLEAKNRQQDWFPLSKARSGKIRISTEWKPLGIAGGISGAASYVAPIGIMRIWIKKATDVKNVESALGGKSDPYVRVMLNNQTLAKTEVVNNNLNPEWDQIVYVPVHRLGERLLLEVMDYQNITSDRSLGTVELKVSDFVRPNTTNPSMPFMSSGGHDVNQPIRQARGQGTKGTLSYHASFCPGTALRGGVHFEPTTDGLAAIPEALTSKGSRRSSYASIKSHASFQRVHKGAPSADSTLFFSPPPLANGGSADTDGRSVFEDEDDNRSVIENESGLDMTRTELLAQQSGVLVIQVIAGRLSRRGRLEVLIDESSWPAFSTAKARSHRQTWDQIGEVFVRELDFSRITLRLHENDENEKEDVYAQVQVDTRNLLESAIMQPTTFTLSSPGNGGERSTVLLSARYVPVQIALEPRESINNMGLLRVELVDGKDIRGVDRSGKSDPYVVFELNGRKVFKSQVQKKTLTPVWNERFETMVESRAGSRFELEVFDWNQIETAKSLGTGIIDLTGLEPFEASEIDVPIQTIKHGSRGYVRVRLVFSPEMIMRSRKNTSTFSAAGRTLTSVGTAPIAVGKGVGKGVFAGGKGVAHGVGALGGFAGRKVGLVRKKDRSGHDVFVEEPFEEVDNIATEETGERDVYSTSGASFEAPDHTREPTDSPRTISKKQSYASFGEGKRNVSVTCLKGKEIDGTSTGEIKPYVHVQIGKKHHSTSHAKKSSEPEWNQTFRFDVSADDPILILKLFDHKTLGKDREIGEAQINLIEYEHSDGPAESWVTLTNGRGQIQLWLEPTNNDLSRIRSASVGSVKSPGRFSIRK